MKVNRRERMLRDTEEILCTTQYSDYKDKDIYVFIGGMLIGDYGHIGKTDADGRIILDNVKEYAPILLRIAKRFVSNVAHYNVFVDDNGIYFYIGTMIKNTNTIHLENGQLVMLGCGHGPFTSQPYYWSKYLSRIILDSGYARYITDANEMLEYLYDDGYGIELDLHARVVDEIRNVKRDVKSANADAPVLVIYDQYGNVVRRDSFYMIRDRIQNILKDAIEKHEYPSFEVL